MKATTTTLVLTVFTYFNSIAQVSFELDYQKKFANMVITPQEYDNWIVNDGFSSSVTSQMMTNRVYSKFKDDFDFIFFISNEKSLPASIDYYGKFVSISNNTTGIGLSISNNSIDYGSAVKLKGAMHIPYRWGLLNGPTLHEFMHNWGNYALQTGIYDLDTKKPDNNFAPHWGFTGGTNPGQLGGFDQSTLVTNVNGDPSRYSVKKFGLNANGGNSIPYSKLELYLMGMIPASDVPTFDVFRDITSVNAVGNNYEFVAGTRETYNGSSLVTKLGVRNPTYLNSQKDFKLLFVVVSSAPLNENEWQEVNNQVDWFAGNKYDDNSQYNFYEATEGKGTINISNLASSLKVNNTSAIVLNNPSNSLKFGISNSISWQTSITGNVKIELFQNGVLKQTLSSSLAASAKTFSWTPNQSLLGELYRLKITSLTDQTIFDFSDNLFNIDYQYYKVSGTVNDETGKPVPNATLVLGDPISQDQAQTSLVNYYPLGSKYLEQSFKPTGSFLNRVDLYMLKSTGSSKDLYVLIMDTLGSILGKDTILNTNIASSYATLSATFFPTVKLTPEKKYIIRLITSDSELYWAQCNPSPYTRGESDLGGTSDYAFTTYSGNGTEIKTNANGYYEIIVNSGYTGQLSLYNTNTLYQSSPPKNITYISSPLPNQNFVLNSPIIISGYVLTANNAKVSNATVSWGQPISIDQSQSSFTKAYEISTVELSQTFVPSVSSLSQIQFAMFKMNTATQPINVVLKKGNTIIGSQTIIPSSFSSSTYWVGAPFIPALTIVPGQEYTVSLTTPTRAQYYWYCDSAAYSKGTASGIGKANFDFAFVTNQGSGSIFLTNADGYYEFRFPSGWNGEIKAVKAGLNLYPLSFLNVTTSLNNQNFKDGVNAVDDVNYTNSVLKVYPNPSSERIFIETSSVSEAIVSVEILNEKGKIKDLNFNPLTNYQTINIAELNGGLYFLKIATNKGNYIRKITKL